MATITGTSGNDILVGTNDQDVLTAGYGDDTLTGGAGNDNLYGDYGNDTYIFDAGWGSDWLYDGNGNDKIVFGAGIAPEDIVLSWSGTSLILQHVNGQDRITIGSYLYEAAYQIEEIRFHDGTVWNVSDVLESVSAILGTNGNETLIGTEEGDFINGGAGNDILHGGAGNDFLYDFSGNDELYGDEGDDSLYGGDGNDALDGGVGNDTLQGNIGDDTLAGGAGNDNLHGDYGNDTYIFDAGWGSDWLYDGNGNDKIVFGAGIAPEDIVLSWSGTSLILQHVNGQDRIAIGNYLLDATYRIEEIHFHDGIVWNASAALAAVGAILGTNDDDTLAGTAQSDFINGGAGNDILHGGAGNDGIYGLAGNDEMHGEEGDDSLYGGVGNDALDGGVGNDTLSGENGDDTLNGGAGNDILYGDNGSDTYLFDAGWGSDFVTDWAGNDKIVFGAGIAPEDIVLSRYGTSLVLQHANGQDRITIGSFYYDSGYQIEEIRFNDGTVWNAAAIELRANDQAPILSAAISPRIATEDSTFSFTFDAGTFTDPDAGDTLTYSAKLADGADLPEWLIFDPATRTFSGTPANGDVGAISIRLTARDIYNKTASTVFTLTVNDTPTVSNTISAQTATEDASFSFTFDENTFADQVRNTLTYSATLGDGSALPGWLTFDAATRTFSGTPVNGDVGIITIRVTATDAGGLSVSDTFTLTVENTNDAPTVPVDIAVWTFENAQLPIDVFADAQDPDAGDTLTITAASVLSGFGSAFVDDEGRLVYDPTTAPNQNIADGETRTVVISYAVSDGNGGSTTGTVTVTVNGVSPDVFEGTLDDDTLTGSIHGDILYGRAGNDTLDGNTGADQMYGGADNDTYIVDNTKDTVIENANEGTDLVKASVSYTLASNVENLTLTGSAITGIGNSLANSLTGSNASNTLDGKAGADRMIGGKGNDTYIVDNSKDVVVEKANEGTDLVKASVSYTLASNVENLTLTGSAITGNGNSLANILTGNSASNTLDGKAGADRMIGGKGNDTYIVDNSKDVVVEKANEGTDLVKSSVSHTLASNVENLTLTGSGKISGSGNSLNNVITGNSANNTLDGKTGSDTLKGGAGNDRLIGGGGGGYDKLYGGSGADTFVFTSAQGATAVKRGDLDTIYDFSRKQGDKIDLKAIDANTKTKADDAFTFIQSDKFHKKAGELRYEIKKGDTFIYGDTNGDGTADFAIRLDLSLAMKGGDFIL